MSVQTTGSAFANQIQNRNYLSPIGFKFTLTKEPKAAFFCNSTKIPEITLSTELQPTYLKDIDVPGDKVSYGDLSIKFLVDENMQNYMTLHNWITSIGFPESTGQFKDLIGDPDYKKQFSDGSLYILNSNYNTTAIVKFKDLFPISLTSLEFDSTQTDIQYFTAEASFKYTIYNILSSDGRTRL